MTSIAIDADAADIPAVSLNDNASPPSAPGAGKVKLYLKSGLPYIVGPSFGPYQIPVAGPAAHTGVVTEDSSGYVAKLEPASGSMFLRSNPSTKVLEWVSVSPGGGMTNPMTAAGSLIVGGLDGAPAELPVGDEGKVLSIVSGTPAWASGGATPSCVPTLSGFTWLNQGLATAVQATAGVHLVAPHDSSHGDMIAGLYIALPSPPYTITAGLVWAYPFGSVCGLGLLLRESSSGKCVTFGCYTYTSPGIRPIKWSSPTGFVGQEFSGTSVWPQGPFWLRIADDGTYRHYSVSMDGKTFVELSSATLSNTDYLTPNQAGIALTNPYGDWELANWFYWLVE